MKRIDIPAEVVRALCERHGVAELSLFGSARREDFGPESDVDLLVTFRSDAEPTFSSLARLQRELAEALHRKVDLVPKDGLKPLIREAIIASAEVLYAA
ncbi:MAG: nucleotidyltransferase domain-containing protein [Kiritimatiellaeota bacterium]|nr:nucleotidyltransferase domain-containing protein [Kiritimatiellota bacterium]